MSRIKIEDLPGGETLNQEELDEILGAGLGKRRLGVEALEDRFLPANSLLSSLNADAFAVSPQPSNQPLQAQLMNPAPNTHSASYWLCARQRSRTPSTEASPPQATGSTWSCSGT